MADGYARRSNRPQCVLVHVDVGTQGLGAAVHDASMGRAPVLIFAGLSPVTIEGEARGSRTEYIHWIQDVPDQKQIVKQYCRYTGEIKSGRNVKQMVSRALSFAMSDPKGPVYLMGAREVMEEEIERYALNQELWRPVEPTALPQDGVRQITQELVDANEPLLITGSSGRNHSSVNTLVKLADAVPGLRVLDTGGSDMCFPASHPAWLGLRYGVEDNIKTADVIIVLECDTPWIPTLCRPKPNARIFHIDVDPLKQLMPVFYIDAVRRYNANSSVALEQLIQRLEQDSHCSEKRNRESFQERAIALRKSYEDKLVAIRALANPSPDGTYGPSYLINRVRDICPRNTIWVIEAVTCTAFVADQIQATLPGSWVNCGGGGLGWSGGGALGVKMAADDEHANQGGESQSSEKPFICQIVGDGTFLFQVPSSVYWISQKYRIPILTVVLNNRGWNAPRRSALLVHPDGEAFHASNEELNISFAPSPDYAGIARAAAGGRCWAGRCNRADELDTQLKEAVSFVEANSMSAVFDAQLDGAQGKFPGGGTGGSSG